MQVLYISPPPGEGHMEIDQGGLVGELQRGSGPAHSWEHPWETKAPSTGQTDQKLELKQDGQARQRNEWKT